MKAKRKESLQYPSVSENRIDLVDVRSRINNKHLIGDNRAGPCRQQHYSGDEMKKRSILTALKF